MRASVVVLSAIWIGCASLPPIPPAPLISKPVIERVFDLQAPPDAVWNALVSAIAERSIEIETIDRASGLLVTAWGSAPMTYCLCQREEGMLEVGEYFGQLRALVRPSGAGTSLEILAGFEGAMFSRENYRQVPMRCYSTGVLERSLYEQIAGRLGVAVG